MQTGSWLRSARPLESETIGHVPPDAFIVIAEETGLINQLRRSTSKACMQRSQNVAADFTLAFNISPVQLRDPTLGLRLLSILGQTGFKPRQLKRKSTERLRPVETAHWHVGAAKCLCCGNGRFPHALDFGRFRTLIQCRPGLNPVCSGMESSRNPSVGHAAAPAKL